MKIKDIIYKQRPTLSFEIFPPKPGAAFEPVKKAAEEIAKQLRLRNLSGIIIVDFIDMAEQEYKEEVIKAVKKAVKKEHIKTAVVGMTELGLLQITRKKTRPSLQQTMTVKCKCCDGVGRVPSLYAVVAQIRQEVIALFENTIYQNVVVEANNAVLRAFCGEQQVFQKELEKEFNKKRANFKIRRN